MILVIQHARGVVHPADWPADLQRPEVRGLFLGGCVGKGLSTRHLRGSAHAHTGGEYDGWICFRSPMHLDSRHVRLHELAHILTRQGHTRRWRACLLAIGGSLDELPGFSRSYHPRARPERAIVERVERDGWVHTTYKSGAVSSRPVQRRPA
jgi:hypothetical protein